MSWESTIDPELEVAYVSGQRRPSWPGLLERFAAVSEDLAGMPGVRLDLPYGPHPRQRFDVVPAVGRARGSLVFFHPGYWQMRDKTLFRFLGVVFAAFGFDTIFPGYPLAPEASVGEITEATRAIVAAVLDEARGRHGRALPMVAAGHSAGGHLAVELALTDPARWGLSASPIAGVLALSGVYDLAPLIRTSLDRALRLTAETARAASPVHRAEAAACPALFVVGGAETPAFLAQNRAMAAAWAKAGARAEVVEAAGEDHFSLIARLADPASDLTGRVVRFLDEVVPAGA